MWGKNFTDASSKDINVANTNDNPKDTVSSIAWCPNLNVRMFAASSWDSKIGLYDTVVSGNQAAIVLKGACEVEDPCLSVTWCDDDIGKLVGGCVNGKVKLFDLQTGKHMDCGAHSHSVKGIHWIPKIGVAITLSFDKTMKFWDFRQQQPLASMDLGEKVYCSDLLLPYLAIGLSHEKLVFVDLDQLPMGFQKGGIHQFESTLGKDSQVTSIAFLKDGSAFGVGSHDGRVNVSKFVAEPTGKLKLGSLISFKTKNYEQNVHPSQQLLYPVHDIGFHHLNKAAIFTAGGEGAINFWDFYKKARLSNYEYKGVPVTRAKMSPDGALLAYATGYDWSLGIQGYMAYGSKIAVHLVQESDLVVGKH
jgi:mRNA export factor